MNYDEALSDSLALVNVVRAAFGYEGLTELPDARRGNTADCLYHRALKDVGVYTVGGSSMAFSSDRIAAVVGEMWGVEAEGNLVDHPPALRQVINAFDSREIDYKDPRSD